MSNNKNNKSGCLAVIFPFMKLANKNKNDEKFSADEFPYAKRDDFLSEAELSFYKVVMQAVDTSGVICPKVGLSDIFFVNSNDRSVKSTYFNKISRKHVDFLICKADDMTPICGIELDDSSHNRKDRQERDVFVDKLFDNAGLTLFRVPVKQYYILSEIKEMVNKAISENEHKDFNEDTKENISKNSKSQSSKTIKVEENNKSQKKEVEIKDKENEIPVCPKCGVPMVLREAKRGPNKGKKFYGCVNYPQCREVIEG